MKYQINSIFIIGLFLYSLISCAGREAPLQIQSESERAQIQTVLINSPQMNAEIIQTVLSRALEVAGIPSQMALAIRESAAGASAMTGPFLSQLDTILKNDDSYLRILVDKNTPLPADYEPDDLIELRYISYRAGIPDLMLLRSRAEAALEEMAAAARSAGHTLVISSAYRSYEYQTGSFERWTARLGLQQAERVSARPGRSQHQLGLAVDFGAINNTFAETAVGRWVAANAGRFGFSLSYPRGYEEITGYAWESWHYRYVGRELFAFIDAWFGGIQHYALSFIHEWENTFSETVN